MRFSEFLTHITGYTVQLYHINFYRGIKNIVFLNLAILNGQLKEVKESHHPFEVEKLFSFFSLCSGIYLRNYKD